MTYQQKLKHPKWQKKRLEILKRDKFICKKCGDTETTLHVHHLDYDGDPWETENKNLITLCEHCHHEIESINEFHCDFNEVRIYKSNEWDDDSRIMFTSYDKICSMRLYDENDKFITGYNFSAHRMHEMIKIFRYTLKNG